MKHHRAHALSAIATACALTGSLLAAIPAHAAGSNDPADMMVQIAMTTDKDTCGISVAPPGSTMLSRDLTLDTTQNPVSVVWGNTTGATTTDLTKVTATGGSSCGLTGLELEVDVSNNHFTKSAILAASPSHYVVVPGSPGVNMGFIPYLATAMFYKDEAATTPTNSGQNGWQLKGTDDTATTGGVRNVAAYAENHNGWGPGFNAARIISYPQKNLRGGDDWMAMAVARTADVDAVSITPPAGLVDVVKSATFGFGAMVTAYPIDDAGQPDYMGVEDNTSIPFNFTVTYSLS